MSTAQAVRALARRQGNRPWRGGLRRKIAGWLLVKLLALAVLWALFFSPAQRVHITPGLVDAQLALPRDQRVETEMENSDD